MCISDIPLPLRDELQLWSINGRDNYKIMSEKRTEISDLGEFGLIDKIQKSTKVTNPSTVLGLGDDAA